VFAILLLMFIFVPVVEIGVLIHVGGSIGLWPTIGLVLITAFVGASLVRSQGLQTLLSVQQRLQQGELPAQQIFEGMLLAVAGVFLLIPGFVTDLVGMVILLPAPRAIIARYLMTRIRLQSSAKGFHSTDNHGSTFDGEFERKKDDDQDKLD
jgi:UPF0716 protein FxsA